MLHIGWQKSNPPLLIFPEFFEVGKYFFNFPTIKNQGNPQK